MHSRKLIVTHHAPDLDAISATWILKKFHAQDFADAKIAFINAGNTITLDEAEQHGSQLHEVTHLDTGLGEFDHHQPDKAKQGNITSSSLVYDHVCKVHPELKDDKALKIMIDFINEIDHFREIDWPEPASYKYIFMIHELINGHEYTEPHDDDSQMHFGMQCLDYAYAALKQRVKAEEIITSKGIEFEIKAGKCLAIATRNHSTMKLAQKKGFVLVLTKDPERGHLRVKVRPDADFDLSKLHQRIQKADRVGTWFYHGGGKMLLNGSDRNRDQKPSPLTLEQMIELIQEIYV